MLAAAMKTKAWRYTGVRHDLELIFVSGHADLASLSEYENIRRSHPVQSPFQSTWQEQDTWQR
jgi:hypothetical protein